MNMRRDAGLEDVVAAILASYRDQGEIGHMEGGTLPSREPIWAAVEDLLRILFPGFLETTPLAAEEVPERTGSRVRSVASRLAAEIEHGLRFESGTSVAAADCDDCAARAWAAVRHLLDAIPAIRAVLSTDIQAAFDGDPAAHSNAEIVIAYPGLQAIAVYRLAHVLYEDGVPIVPRVMTEYAHSRTGIDIHPGAKIGKRFFIDHGTGVVIGETCEIGDGVKIYQGVTLGARSFPRDDRGRAIKGAKRHPDIEAGVTIYSGATILGRVTIGRGSVIGGNVWLVHSVPPGSRVTQAQSRDEDFERGSGI